MITLNIDREDAQNAYDFMDMEFLPHLKTLLEMDDLDNKEYVRSLLKVMDELLLASQQEVDDED